MSVWVDEITEYPPVMIKGAAKRCGRKWSHMTADSLEELHHMAAKIGMKRAWFQNHPMLPHYDVVPSRRALAITYGAIERPGRETMKLAMERRKAEREATHD